MTDSEKRYAFAIGHTKSLDETHPHLKDFVEFLDDFNKETERGAALAAAAFLDALLERVLAAFLIPNDSGFNLTNGFNAPLGTLSARIAACHAMGLISEAEYKECELIRKVRNEFAHKAKMSFKDDKVRGLCSALMMSAKSYDDVKVDARNQFTTAAVSLILNLTNRPHYVGQQALKHRNWKI
jgi:hypothetical protein